MTIDACLTEMRRLYQEDRVAAVRGQHFIRTLHRHLAGSISARLTEVARRDGVEVKEEAKLFGSHKPKDVDVAVVHPNNGPLMIVGVRSQMSSVAKNALTYYQDIVGECISLQDRFPLATIGYVYLMPLAPTLPSGDVERVDHARYAKMYGAISGRTGESYKNVRGVYDHFAYMVVDFEPNPPALCDHISELAVPRKDLKISTFVDRMVGTYIERDLFLDYFV